MSCLYRGKLFPFGRSESVGHSQQLCVSIYSDRGQTD